MINHVWNVNYCEYEFTTGDTVAKLTVLHWDCTGTDDVTQNSDTAIGTQDVSEDAVEKPTAEVKATAQDALLDLLFKAMPPEEKLAVEQTLTARVEDLNKPTGGGFVPPQDEVTP